MCKTSYSIYIMLVNQIYLVHNNNFILNKQNREDNIFKNFPSKPNV